MRERDEGLAPGWALRRYAGLVALVVLVTMGLSMLVAQALRRDVGYTATALVIAKQLTVRQEQLPRFGESVFNGGSVARAVAGTASADDYRTLVPDKISMDPIPDTIAFRVQGHSEDPGEAARLANAAADAFVDQLNKAGAGVGSFSLQDPAYVPFERDLPLVSYPLAALIGLTGGSILAVVLVAGLVGLRRPLLSAEAAADAAAAPLLAVVTLPKKGSGNARGLRNLLEVLPTLPSRVVELVGPTGSRSARKSLLEELPGAQQARGAAAGPSRRQVLVTDLLDETDVRLDLPAATSKPEDEALASVLVVVPEGASRRAVSDLVGDFPDEEVAGVVFLRRRRRLRPETTEAAAEAAATPSAAPPSPSKAAESRAPEAKAPEAKAPETKAPETKTPETKTPETKTPETKTPETKTPETKTPETKTPETKTPETKTPETKTPETEAPDAPADKEAPAANQGRRWMLSRPPSA